MDSDILNARRLQVGRPEKLQVFLVGCGGTGSWLAPHVARLVLLLRDKFNPQLDVFLIDPDTVEEKNVYRQNFCFAEVGQNKAASLALRLNAAWGLDIRAVPESFNPDLFEKLRQGGWGATTLLIGCVDNHLARQSLAKAAEAANAWWLDCGNSKESGQVLLGRAKPPDPSIAFMLQGMTTWLPLPSLQHPELLEPEADEPQVNETGLSCADLALLDAQALSINARIAAEAADFLFRAFLTGDLRRCAAYLSLGAGSTQSRYNTEENLRVFLS